MYRFLCLASVMVLFSILTERPAAAQAGPVPRYYPSRSAISPYLNFFMGPDPGTLDRYNAYVRPAQQLQRNVNAQNTQIQQLQGEVQFLRKTGAGATGVGGSFMNYSHYFPGGGGGRRR